MKRKAWISIIICLLCMFLCSCGSSSSPDSTNSNSEEEPAATEVEVEDTEEPAAIKVALGDTIETENFKMTIDSIELVDNYPVPNTNSTFVPSPGHKMLLVKGAFENKTDSDFSNASFKIFKTVNGDSSDCKVFFEEEDQWTAPATSDTFYFVPVEISEHQLNQYDTATITISFRDDISAITPDYTENVTNVYEIDCKYK